MLSLETSSGASEWPTEGRGSMMEQRIILCDDEIFYSFFRGGQAICICSNNSDAHFREATPTGGGTPKSIQKSKSMAKTFQLCSSSR